MNRTKASTARRMGVVDDDDGDDIGGLSPIRPPPRRKSSDGGGGDGNSILPPSRRREEDNKTTTTNNANDDVKLSPPVSSRRSPNTKKHKVQVKNRHPKEEIGTPTSSPSMVKTKKKSSSSKSPKRKSTKQSNNSNDVTTIKEDQIIPTNSSSSKKSPKKSPKKKKLATADDGTDNNNNKKEEGGELSSPSNKKKKKTEKSPKRKSKKTPRPSSKSPNKKQTELTSSSVRLPLVPQLEQDSNHQDVDKKLSPPPSPGTHVSSSPVASSPGKKKPPPPPADNSSISSPIMSPGKKKGRKSMGNIDSPNNYSFPKLMDVDGTSFKKDLVQAETSCPQLMIYNDDDDDDDDRKPPASPKRKKKVKNDDDNLVGEESIKEMYEDDAKSPKIKKKKKKQSTTEASAPAAVPIVASMPNESRHGVSDEDDKGQKRRSAAAAPGAAVNPGAVAVRGIRPHDDFEPSDEDEDEDAPPKKKKKKKKQNRLELASGTEEEGDVAFVSIDAQQRSSSNGPKPVPGSEYLNHAASTTTIGRKPTNGDVEEGLNGDRGVDGNNPIEAHLVDDEDAVADRIAQRVQAQMEAQFIQQRQEEEARRVTATAVNVDESPEVASAPAQQGKEGDKDDACCFGLSRNVIISLVGVFLILVIVVAVVAAVLAPGPEPTASPTLSPTEEPTAEPTVWLEVVGASKRFKSLLSLLEPAINPAALSPLEFLQNQDSPQFKAIEWMADEDSSGIPFDDDSMLGTLVERYALMVLFFNSGQGSSPLLDLGFKSSSPVCSWHDDGHDDALENGIQCQSESRVSRVWLPKYDLQNTVPSELGLLTYLEEMNFNDNYFSGSLPTEIFRLSNLTRMWFLDSGLIGPIPTEIGSLTNLWSLDLRENALTGPVPSEMGSISSLYEIYLRSNRLNGSLPTQLGNLVDLNFLSLGENHIEGGIPTELGLVELLIDLRLNDNGLSGMVPSALGSLYTLEVLWLQRNADLSGKIPSELGMLLQLTSLAFQDTGITGDVDPIFCDAFQMNPWDELYADCHSLNQKVVCSCCTHCCSNAGCVANSDSNECPDPPEATPIDLDPDGVVISGSTIGAIVNMPTDTSFCDIGLGGSPTRWYVFEADATSTVTMTTCSSGTAFDTVIGVFQLDCGDNICIAGNDDHELYEGDAADRCSSDEFHSLLSFNAEASETYYIAISGFDSGDAGEFELVVDPPIYNGGQNIIHLITGTYFGVSDGCAIEGSDGTRFDLGPVSLMLWVCPNSGVIGASLHGDVDDEGNNERTFIFFGSSVEQGDDYVLYDVSLEDLDTDEEFDGFTFNIFYQEGNLLVNYGGDDCEVQMFPDDLSEVGTLDDFC